MSVVYITNQRGYISKKGKHLVLNIKGQEPVSILTFKLDQMVLVGNIEISTAAIRHLLYSGVELVFLSYDGKFIGRVVGELPKNIFLRREQYKKLENEDFVKKMARKFVKGKLKNQLILLKRIKRTYNPPRLDKILDDFGYLIRLLEKAATLNQIRGYEGKGSALFFRGFPMGFRNQHDFKKRVRRPPTDPVNAVLSFCYTLLMNRIYGAVYAAGLDPYLGSLHAISYGRPSLVFDLMEEFRTIIVETLTLSLFNLKILTSDDFYLYRPKDEPDVEDLTGEPDILKDPLAQMETVPRVHGIEENALETEEGEIDWKKEKVYPVRLKEDALKKLLHQFERKMKTRFYYSPLGRPINYQKAIYEQTKQYAKLIKGEIDDYRPLQMQ